MYYPPTMARTDPQVNFRMPADLKERLENAAKKHGRSVTQEIIQRLEHSFNQWKTGPSNDPFSARTDLPREVKADRDSHPIPEGAELQQLIDQLPPPESDKDAIATKLAIAVLQLTGRLPEPDMKPAVGRLSRTKAINKPVLVHPRQSPETAPEKRLAKIAESVGRPRTPKIPGQNAPKKGIGRAPKGDKVQKD